LCSQQFKGNLIQINAGRQKTDNIEAVAKEHHAMPGHGRSIRMLFFGLLLLPAALLVTTGHAADPEAGQSVFRSQCAICHSTQAGRNMVGPSLAGLIGRKTGAVAGYSYSVGNQNANITWTPDTLEKYLESPRTVVPGTKMTYAGLKDPGKRADLIAFLMSQK
jgi:cytochrome c